MFGPRTILAAITAALLVWFSLAAPVSVASAGQLNPQAPRIFNYGIQYLNAGSANPSPGIISYMPFPGNSYAPSSPNCTLTWNYQWTNGLPVTAFYLDSTSPITTNISSSGYVRSNSLADTLTWFTTNIVSAGIPLNYIMMDDEPYAGYGNNLTTVENELLATVALVRASANPNVNQAYIGDYAIYPGGTDAALSFQSRIATSSFYTTSGLNIAQPNAYPYTNYTVNGPTLRSGMFWSDLELVSFVETNMPAGHLLIPWMDTTLTTNVPQSPTRADNVALLGQFRLRGADGFCDLGGLEDRIYGWTDWDWLFNGTGSTQILNLATSKSSGFQWSGYQVGTNFGFLFSNLGTTAASTSLPALANLPATSPVVPPTNHWALDFINDPAHVAGSTIYLGRDGINHGLFVNATGTLTNSIMVAAPGTNPPAVVTIGSDLAGNYAPVFSGAIMLSNYLVLQNLGTNAILFSGPVSGSFGLTNIGSGTNILSSSASSFSGGTTISSGTLQISNPAAIGSGTITIPKTGTNSGTLQLAFTGSQFLLNTFNGFNSTTVTGDSTVPDLENLSGTTLILGNLTVTSTGGNGISIKATGGLIKLEGTISTTLTYREVELNGAGTGEINGVVADGGTGLSFGLVKDGPGIWTLAGANTYTAATTINNGNLQVSGSLAVGTTVAVGTNGTLSGAGLIGGPVILNGAIAPGNGDVGTLTTGNETWNAGGAYLWQLNNATNTAGQDLLTIRGSLTLPSNPTPPFVIRVISLTTNNAAGPVTGFSGANNYSWIIATASGGIANFNPAAFTVNTSGFSNSFAGTFAVMTNGTALVLAYTAPVPSVPVLSAVGQRAPGAFSLSFSVTNSQSYRVLATTNLAFPLTNWLVLTNGTFGNGTMNFTDATATNPQRFYRIASP